MNESLPNSKGPAIQKTDLEALLNSYASIDDIPDDILIASGYVRISSGRIMREADARRYAEQERERREQKDKYVPFDQVSFTVSETLQARALSFPERKRIERIFNNLEDPPHEEVVQGVERILGVGSPEVFLLNVLQSDVVKDRISHDSEAYGWLISKLFLEQKNYMIRYAYESIEEAEATIVGDYRSYDQALSREDASELLIKLERLRGKLSDSDFYAEWHRENLEATFAESMSVGNREEDEKFITQFKDFSAGETMFEVSKKLFGFALEVIGNEELSKRIRASSGPEEIIELAKKHIPVSPQELEVKNKIRTANEEERRQLSGRLKILKEKREVMQRLLFGIVSFYKTPDQLAKYLNRTIGSIQEFLSRGPKEVKQDLITLKGTPDVTLDANPGAISGDCTEGHPLPFDTEIPVYNIKVFNGENQHAGNIYLLHTNLRGLPERKVWHLDAIQIPSSVDWAVDIQKLFKALQGEARKKLIHGITVSVEKPTISNYDYLQDAVTTYCANIKAERVVIDIPSNPKPSKYSNFQSNGSVYLIPVNERQGDDTDHI